MIEGQGADTHSLSHAVPAVKRISAGVPSAAGASQTGVVGVPP